MKKRKRFMRIQPLIALSIVSIALFVTLLISGSLYGKFKQITTDNSIREANNTLLQVNANAQLYIEQLIEDCLFLESILEENKGYIGESIENKFDTMFTTRSDMISISLIDNNGEILLITPNLEIRDNLNINNQEWFKEVKEENDLYYITDPSTQELFKNNTKWTYAICANIKYSVDGIENSYVLRMDMDFSQIADLCINTNIGERGYMFLADENNELLFHGDQAIISTGQIEEKAISDYIKLGLNDSVRNKENSTIVIKSDLNYVNWTLVGVIYEDAISTITNEIIEFILLIFILAVGMTIILSLFISRQISKPIQQLEGSMRKVTAGDLETRLNISSSETEVVALANSFNHMVSRIQKLIKENEKEHELKMKSDLDALQAQINPHFLYNTLDSIVWMAECEQNEEVVEMVNALAKLFRISISGGRDKIELRDEINHAENYMLIQKKRYNERFDYIIEVDEKIKHLKVPKLMLQPLIENALYHGIEYMVDPGEIKIKAEIKKNLLYLYVIDNGMGMSKEDLENIWNKVKKKSSGVGIKNVNERIQIMFGIEYGISFESEIEEGTKVTLKLPIIKEDSDEK